MPLPLPKVHQSPSPVAGFLGMSDVHECPVGFKWLWWLFTNRHLVVNRHMTANSCCPLIWLLFVAFEAQMDHCWGHFGVSVTDVCLARPQPSHRDHLRYWLKHYLKWQAIRLAIH